MFKIKTLYGLNLFACCFQLSMLWSRQKLHSPGESRWSNLTIKNIMKGALVCSQNQIAAATVKPDEVTLVRGSWIMQGIGLACLVYLFPHNTLNGSYMCMHTFQYCCWILRIQLYYGQHFSTPKYAKFKITNRISIEEWLCSTRQSELLACVKWLILSSLESHASSLQWLGL